MKNKIFFTHFYSSQKNVNRIEWYSTTQLKQKEKRIKKKTNQIYMQLCHTDLLFLKICSVFKCSFIFFTLIRLNVVLILFSYSARFFLSYYTEKLQKDKKKNFQVIFYCVGRERDTV